MAKKGESYFWTSYSDMMTSLFFIMLVLFILVIVLLHTRMEAIDDVRKKYETELKNIKELQQSIKDIDRKYFELDTKFNRFTLKDVVVKFKEGSSNMEDIDAESREKLAMAGRAIVNFMIDARYKNPKAEYLVIIEGQASKDSYSRNDQLSYERALALFDYWQNDCRLSFGTLPCEVIISGSGTRSKFREPEMIYVEGKQQKNPANQRFVIHIIPKLSEMENALK